MNTTPIDIKSCPSCGSKTIRKVRRKWHGSAQGQSYVVENLEYYECPDCDEMVYPPQAMRRIEEHSPTYRRPRKLRA